jgi:DNA-directed RNA polymerase specialized sigma24 family protein
MSLEQDTPALAATHWAAVLKTRKQDTSRAMDTMAQMCRTYWHPLYAHVRLRGHSPDEAKALTKEFFFRLLQNNKTLAYMRRDCGKFRSFLLSAMNHFLVDEWRKGRAVKPDARLDADASEKVFEKNWALAVQNAVFDRLKQEYARLGQSEVFSTLKFCLTSNGQAVPEGELSQRLAADESTVRAMINTLRERYRDLLCEEVASSVATAAEADEELRCLFQGAIPA